MNKFICYKNEKIFNKQDELDKINKINIDYAQIILDGSHAKKAENENKSNIMLVSGIDFIFAIQFKWYLSKNGYPSTYGTVDKKIKWSAPVAFHRIIKNRLNTDNLSEENLNSLVVDHINRNRLDNRRSNLRLCTQLQNSYNKTKPNIKNPSSKYKGVIKSGNNYNAIVIKNGKKYEVKGFKTEIEAAKVYDMMAQDLFGQYAGKNFVA
jgi:hypothetical protein